MKKELFLKYSLAHAIELRDIPFQWMERLKVCSYTRILYTYYYYVPITNKNYQLTI